MTKTFQKRSKLIDFGNHKAAKHATVSVDILIVYKLARIIYAMLKNQIEYQDPGEGCYEEQARQRAIKNLKRKANQLGFQLIGETAA